MISSSTEENFLAHVLTKYLKYGQCNILSTEQLNFKFYFTLNSHIWLWRLFGQYRSSPICYYYSTAEKVTKAVDGRFKSFQTYVELDGTNIYMTKSVPLYLGIFKCN